MKIINRTLVALALLLTASLALADEHPPEAQAAYQEMKAAFGVVPTFMKQFPEEAVAAAWDEMKGVQLSDGAIGGKTKELIGLAVAAQIPCHYCIYFHTAAAKLHGATDREIKEAVVMAAITRHWSTFLNGTATDEATFRAELQKAFAYAKQPHPGAAAAAPVTDAASAYKDIERTLGSVPTFFRQFPEAGIAGAWREYKGVLLNPATALPGKTKELIGLSVASQIPCHYCVFAHTEGAKLYGATDGELHEAVAMASMTRFWSTFLNGAQVDEATFRKETDQIVKLLKSKTASR